MTRPVKAPAAPARAGKTKAAASDLRDKAQTLGALALETLEGILRGGGSDTSKIAAAREVLDRAYGKSKAEEKEAEPKKLTVVIRRFGDGGAEEG